MVNIQIQMICLLVQIIYVKSSIEKNPHVLYMDV
jgi:hypothetical protein